MHRRELLRGKQPAVLTPLRQQVQSVLYALPAKRKPALRRSDLPDALFATDLPLVAEADAVAAFRADLARLGWHTAERSGWLTLDAPVPAPEADVPASLQGECGCCISLLLRHEGNAPAQGYIRDLAKAAEAGCQATERLCMRLHGDFALRLRRLQPLPGALLPYLCFVHNKLYP